MSENINLSEKLPSSKLDVKLMAFDLDDTLLTSECKISPKTVEVLQKAAKKGIYIVLCSGRMEHGILPHVRTLEIAGLETGRYIIAMNGSSIFDLHLRQQIFSRKVPEDVLLEIFHEAQRHGLPAQVYFPDRIYANVSDEWTALDAKLCNVKMEAVEDFEGFLKGGHSKMLIPGEPEKLKSFEKELKEKFSDRAEVFTSKPFFLEIMTKNAGKGQALEELSKRLGISLNNVMCFGDSYNDESMMRKAELSVCMINGNDDMKKICRYVTRLDNNNDGIAEFLNEWVL